MLATAFGHADRIPLLALRAWMKSCVPFSAIVVHLLQATIRGKMGRYPDLVAGTFFVFSGTRVLTPFLLRVSGEWGGGCRAARGADDFE